jgi:YesN/AraC family two-component response regulator
MNRITPEIISYIEEHCYEKINLADLAQMCFYNPSYFSKIFKETFGKNLTDFIQEKRIEKAIELLKHQEATIDEIVQKVGFCDKKQFYKIFKKITGVTPGEFR